MHITDSKRKRASRRRKKKAVARTQCRLAKHECVLPSWPPPLRMSRDFLMSNRNYEDRSTPWQCHTDTAPNLHYTRSVSLALTMLHSIYLHKLLHWPNSSFLNLIPAHVAPIVTENPNTSTCPRSAPLPIEDNTPGRYKNDALIYLNSE